MIDPLITKFEEYTALPKADIAKLLGYSRSAYYQMRAYGPPATTRRLIEVIMRMSPKELQRTIQYYVGDDEL
jgi:hypothetical protein